MRRSLITLLIVTGAAATPSAQAARVWGRPTPITGYQVDVGADGTTVEGSDAAVAALPGGGAIVADTTARGDGGPLTSVRVRGADRSFGASQPVGPGVAIALRTNRAGDAAILLGDYTAEDPSHLTLTEAFAPAGRTFGVPAQLPVTGSAPIRGELADLVLGDDGTATVHASRNGTPMDIQVVSRYRDGAVGEPSVLADATSPGLSHGPVLAADGHGRVLAAWTSYDALFTAWRGTDGNWSAPQSTALPGAAFGVDAAMDPAGDAVVAWYDQPDDSLSGELWAATATPDGGLSAPMRLDTGVTGGPVVAENAQGSAIVTDHFGQYHDANAALHVTSRSGTGAFGAPQVAGCGGSIDAWLSDLGDATLQTDNGLIHDAPGPFPDAPCTPPGITKLTVAGRRRNAVRVRVADSRAERLTLTWRTRGRVLTRRTIVTPVSVTLRTRGAAHLRSRLVLRRGASVVAVRRVPLP